MWRDWNREGDNESEKKVSRPTLIAHGGFDSTLEEMYSSAAAPALVFGIIYSELNSCVLTTINFNCINMFGLDNTTNIVITGAIPSS